MSTLLDQFKKVQPCDGRGLIQILLQTLTQEVLSLKNRACTKFADIFTEYGIDSFSPCESLTEEFLQEIQSGDPIQAINTLLAARNFPPHVITVLTKGIEGVSQEEEQEVYEWVLDSQQIQTHPDTARYVRSKQNREHNPFLNEVGARLVEEHYTQQGITNLTTLVTSEITSLITSRIKCPSDNRLINLINTVNNLVALTNIFQSNFNRLQTAVNISSASINIITGIIRTAENTAKANNTTITALAASGVGAAATGPIVQLNVILYRAIDKYGDQLKELDEVVCNAAKVIQFISLQLSVLRSLLAVIDGLLSSCIEKSNIDSSLRKLNTFNLDINDRIQYYGYTIEIRATVESTVTLPQRYAVAIDETGTVVLEGPKSYSASTSILVDEIKFRIDNQLG